MDFLEGALLGPLWSDTDYEDKTHHLMGFVYIVIVYGWVLFLFRQHQTPLLFRGMTGLIWLAGTVLLTVASSFLASRYYRVGLASRLGILAVITLKYGVGTGFLVSLFRPFYGLDRAALKDGLLHFLDSTVGDFVFQASARFRIPGLIASGALVSILGLVLLVLLVSLLIALPIFYLRLIRQGQAAMDKLLLRMKTAH